jgi:hypothetical protein
MVLVSAFLLSSLPFTSTENVLDESGMLSVLFSMRNALGFGAVRSGALCENRLRILMVERRLAH